MNILKNIEVPTGNILIVEGEKGKLECLSIGDYGKENNIKADFMGLTKEINGVEHKNLMPLEDKWVVTISTQYGCSMGCRFCDVPKVGAGLNATAKDLIGQVETCLNLHPEVKNAKRLNLHYARMGEPTWNGNVLRATREIKKIMDEKNFGFHPVISTMMPKNNKDLDVFLYEWMHIKNDLLNGEAGLQLSINTTDDEIRSKSMSDNTLSLEKISKMVNWYNPKGRKITLNFALTEAPIDAYKLKDLFNPEKFLCKITPMHITDSCTKNNMLTPGNAYNSFYPYKRVEEDLKNAGYDVIVFVPSKEEDESRITCGNAILSDKEF